MPTITRDETAIEYEVSGDGPPLILGSSFLMNREMWRPQLDRLNERYRVIAPDWRGHGESGPIRGRVTLDDLADDLEAILDAQGIERAVWGGLSLGGMVAMRKATRNASRVAALILADTDAGSWALLERMKFRSLGLVALTAGMKAVTPIVLRIFFARRTRREKPELMNYWRKSMQALTVASVYRLLEALDKRPSMTEDVRAITVPTLILHGADDKAIPPQRADALHQAIEGSRLRILPECGHIASLDQPELVNEEIAQLLESLS